MRREIREQILKKLSMIRLPVIEIEELVQFERICLRILDKPTVKNGNAEHVRSPCFNPKARPIPPYIGEPKWEWFKPTGDDYLKLNEAMMDHVDRGGLDIRPRNGASSAPQT